MANITSIRLLRRAAVDLTRVLGDQARIQQDYDLNRDSLEANDVPSVGQCVQSYLDAW